MINVDVVMKEYKVLPFYMSYPMPFTLQDDKDMVKDLEYLQQMYPSGSKRLLVEVNKALAVLDYDGSMIYDQYPDRFMMHKLGKDILENLQRSPMKEEDEQLAKMLEWDNIDELVIVILFCEVLKRRHHKTKGYLQF